MCERLGMNSRSFIVTTKGESLNWNTSTMGILFSTANLIEETTCSIISTLNLVTNFRISSLGEGRMYNSFSFIVVLLVFLTILINIRYVPSKVHKKSRPERRPIRLSVVLFHPLHHTLCFLGSYETASTFSP